MSFEILFICLIFVVKIRDIVDCMEKNQLDGKRKRNARLHNEQSDGKVDVES